MRGWRLTVCAALLLATSAYGRVFWRWRSGEAVDRTLAHLGAQRGYEAPVSVNGVGASAEVYRMPSPNLEAALSTLKRTFPEMRFSHAGGNMVIGRGSDTVQSLIVIQVDPAAPVVIFAIRSDGSKSIPAHPARHLLAGLPAFPDSRPVFHAEDRNAGMSLAVAGSTMAPQAVLAYYESQLPADGWIPAFPAQRGHSIQVYLRGRDIATLTAVRDHTDRATRITLLHKQPGRTTY